MGNGALSGGEMVIGQITDPNATLAMIPWFIATEQPAVNIGWELSRRMADQPDDTLVLIGIEGKGVKAVVASFVETDPQTGQRHVFIWQARVVSGADCGREIMAKIEQWAKEKGIGKIVTGTYLSTRRVGAMCRRHGFKKLKDHYLVKEI